MTNPNQSHVDVHEGGTTFVGPDAVNLFRATALMCALETYARSKMIMTRGLTVSAMVLIATSYTGKTYKKNQAGAAIAAKDVRIWVETMRAAMPVVHS